MRKKEVALALLGFVVGAAALAGGEDDGELVEELRSLQRSAERVILREPATEEYAPSVGPGYKLGLFPVFDLTAGIPDHLPPTLGYLDEESESPLFGGISEERPQPYGTIEELCELLQASVEPASWDEGGTISVAGQSLVVFASPIVLSKVGEYLNALRERTFVSVTTELKIVEVSREVRQRLIGGDTALSDEQLGALNDALADGRASVLFSARTLGLSKQQTYLGHGTQHAVQSDADVEVAQTARTTDPVVDVLQTGGFVSVRPTISDDAAKVVLELDVRLEALEEPIRSRETIENGILDLPSLERSGFRTALSVSDGRWALAGKGGRGDEIRLLLVKATIVPAKGGVR